MCAVLHSIGVVHTDIKPDNILLKSGSEATLRFRHGDGTFYNKVCLVIIGWQLCLMDVVIGGASEC